MSAMEKVLFLKLENGATLEVRADEALALKAKDICVFNRDFYEDLGEVVRILPAPSMTSRIEELPQVLRKAGDPELATANENFRKARNAMPTVQEWITRLNLAMAPVNAHYSLDCKLLTVQFCADGRIDFRELVKELSRALSTRIELRQIGVRDETGNCGGIAVCGRPLCCSTFLKEFNSINVRMAKEQDLALTPSTISGVCGRLKCCLKFEHEGYLELAKDMPRKGEMCSTPAGRGKITDRNLLTRNVVVTFENSVSRTFNVDEITLDRNNNENRRNSNNNNRSDENSGNNHHSKNGNDKKHSGKHGNGQQK